MRKGGREGARKSYGQFIGNPSVLSAVAGGMVYIYIYIYTHTHIVQEVGAEVCTDIPVIEANRDYPGGGVGALVSGQDYVVQFNKTTTKKHK